MLVARPALESEQYCPVWALQQTAASLTEEFKVTRAREVLMYRDTSVPSVGIAVRRGRRWWAWDAVEQAEARL